jgi:hypothetical protein
MAGTKPGIEVTGAKELRKALKHMGADLADLTATNRAAAEQVAERARDHAPRRSGRLAKTIRARASKTKASVIAGSAAVPYAGPIHFGWHRRHIVPNPFLYDALDERRGEVVAAYSKRVGDLVERVGRETP